MTARPIDGALERLYRRALHGIKLGLDAEEALLSRLNNPHKCMSFIHVAGTNGKGSVCAMIDSILREAGVTTGLYTSPHLEWFNERIRVNGEAISDADLSTLLDVVDYEATALAEEEGRDVTFFECATALAIEHFRQQLVQIAVLETGLGGRLDATNVVTPLISVITSIGYDHQKYLGQTIKDIAMEKCGIIKEGRPVLCGPLQDEAREVAVRTARERNAPIFFANDLVTCTRKQQTFKGQRIVIDTESERFPVADLPLIGRHQLENCSIAVATLHYLSESLSLDIDAETITRGLSKVEWPARCQVLCDDPPVVLDAAHNPGGAKALFNTLREVCGKRKLALVSGFANDKDVNGFLREMAPLVEKAWAIPIDNERALPVEETFSAMQAAGIDVKASSVDEALTEAMAWAREHDGIVCIAGSIYLAGEVMGLSIAD